MTPILYILADFGGPRDLDEIHSFIHELLLDPEVIRPKLPKPLHYLLFSRIAKKRAKKISKEYEKLGGRSPIYFYTEELVKRISLKLNAEVIAFHRYLPKTHTEFIKKVNGFHGEVRVVPLFPQFTFAVTGSMARFFAKHIKKEVKWIKSFPTHPDFLLAQRENIQQFLKEKNIQEDELFFIFSCHGIPKSYAEDGDLYEQDCQASFQKTLSEFPRALGMLSFQSRFGSEEWLQPYTEDVCLNIKNFSEGRKKIVIVPLSFISDHIETLYEIEELYLPLIQKQELLAYRCPALNFHPLWEEAIVNFFKQESWQDNSQLIRVS